jgi:two-component system response regulator MprA
LLVIEDDRAGREVLLALLQGEGYDAEAVSDGREALARMELALPSVILLDLLMPRMDGRAFVRELERRGLRQAVAVLVLSAAAHAEEDAREMGADGYLAKPYELEELFGEIDRLCAGPI